MPTHAAERWFPADEPAANGHFPGNPISSLAPFFCVKWCACYRRCRDNVLRDPFGEVPPSGPPGRPPDDRLGGTNSGRVRLRRSTGSPPRRVSRGHAAHADAVMRGAATRAEWATRRERGALP